MAEVEMSEKELRDLVRTTVLDTLEALGADVENPLEMQRDFQSLRDWRKSKEAIASKGFMWAVGIFLSGIGALLLIGLKDFIRLQ